MLPTTRIAIGGPSSPGVGRAEEETRDVGQRVEAGDGDADLLLGRGDGPERGPGSCWTCLLQRDAGTPMAPPSGPEHSLPQSIASRDGPDQSCEEGTSSRAPGGRLTAIVVVCRSECCWQTTTRWCGAGWPRCSGRSTTSRSSARPRTARPRSARPSCCRPDVVLMDVRMPGDGRRRGDPPDPQGGAGRRRPGADDVRRRRDRLHGDAGRSPGLPAQGRRAGRDRRRHQGGRPRPGDLRPGDRDAPAAALLEPPSEVAARRAVPGADAPASARSSASSRRDGGPPRSPRRCTCRPRR